MHSAYCCFVTLRRLVVLVEGGLKRAGSVAGGEKSFKEPCATHAQLVGGYHKCELRGMHAGDMSWFIHWS